jgi:GT2 family glycosyltransferase
MGLQNIFNINTEPQYSVSMLIGFCVLVRKEALEKVGGVDASNPNCGDDLDLSIRLTDAGYKLVVDKSVFIFHHGFKTGERLFGNAKTNNGWNSYEQYLTHLSKSMDLHGGKDSLWRWGHQNKCCINSHSMLIQKEISSVK